MPVSIHASTKRQFDRCSSGVDSLAYLSKEGMVEAAQANAGHFCTACFDGAYPIEMDESVSGSKLMLEPKGIAATV